MEYLIMLASAFGVGAAHALEPGHGKTVVAAYLVGSRGRTIDAVILGGVVTFTHTFSVLLLAIASTVAAAYFVPQQVERWLGIGSGILVVAVGAWMIYARTKHGPPVHSHSHAGHSHGPPAHDHGQAHDHGHPHHGNYDHNDEHPHDHPHPHADATSLGGAGVSPASDGEHVRGRDGRATRILPQRSVDGSALLETPHPHAAPDNPGRQGALAPVGCAAVESDAENATAPQDDHRAGAAKGVGMGSLVALGISGGIVPCPAALVLLLAAVGLGQVTRGVALLVSFSLGLALVLMAIGIATVKAAGFASGWLERGSWTRRISIASAYFITALGIALTVKAFITTPGAH